MKQKPAPLVICIVPVACLAVLSVFLSPAAESAAAAEPPRFEGLGPHTRKVATASPEAQRYFDQGLAFLYAFNHDEAIRSFRRAAELDPSCAMAWWGIAVANGPHINNPAVPPDREKAAFEAAGRARKAAEGAGAADRPLIEAVGARHADTAPEDRRALDEAYAAAMRKAWQAHPGDADVGALFAEAMMDLRPWDLWTPDGKPQPGTPEIVATLESVLAKSPNHPLALHLYIHAVEMSLEPGKADAAAERLRDLAPGLGHLVHMPSHIDVRRGRWEQAIASNAKAIEADRTYRARSPRQGFYGLYMAHNHHMLAYAAMMTGRSAEALRVIDEMVASVPEGFAKEYAAVADGFMAMPLEVRMRFGRWEEILAAPEQPDHFPIARALRRYARGVALAALGRTDEARAEQREFRARKAKVPAEAFFGNNAASDLLAVAESLLEGEILYREGKVEPGLAELRRAVEAEDRLRYDEPPDWIQPVRHALGAALVREGRHREAEEVYREDLRRLPGNGWSLYGLARALRAQGKTAEAAEVESRFAAAWAKADVTITSSCLCQPGA
jgi:tetratricopeptide (TPR) repeat protein